MKRFATAAVLFFVGMSAAQAQDARMVADLR